MLSLLSSLEEGSDDDDDDEVNSPMQTMFVLTSSYSDLTSVFAVLFRSALCKLVDEKARKKRERKSETIVVSSMYVYNHELVVAKDDFSHVFAALLMASPVDRAGVPETEWKLMKILLTELCHAGVHGVLVQCLFLFDIVSLTEEEAVVSHGNPAIQLVVEDSMAAIQVFSHTGMDDEDRRQHSCKLSEGLKGAWWNRIHDDPFVVDQKIFEKGRSLDDASFPMLLHVKTHEAVEGYKKEMLLSSFIKYSKGSFELKDLHKIQQELRPEIGDAQKGAFFHLVDEKSGYHGSDTMGDLFTGREAFNEGDNLQGPLVLQLPVINQGVIPKAAKDMSGCQGTMETSLGAFGLSLDKEREFENARKWLFCLFPGINHGKDKPPDNNAMLFPRQRKADFLECSSADFKEKRRNSLLDVIFHEKPFGPCSIATDFAAYGFLKWPCHPNVISSPKAIAPDVRYL